MGKECTPSGTLTGLLGGLRARIIAQEFFRRLAVALSFAVIFLGLEMFADFFFEFSLELRRMFLIAGGAVFAILLVRAIASLVTARRDEETLALMVEKSHPAFDSRLISSIQFANGHAAVPPDGALPLITRTVEETEDEAKRANFGEAADGGPLRRALISALLIILVAAGAVYAARDVAPTLFARVFLADKPVPRDTNVLSVSGDIRIGAGDPVAIEAIAEGVLPETARLDIRYESGRRQSITMGRDKEHGEDGQARYVIDFEEVPESFTYRVRVNDGRSDRHKVAAIVRPRIDNLTGEQIFPEFTQLEPSTHNPGGFNLFPGSEFTLRAKANKGLESGVLTLIGQDKEIPLEVDPNDATVATAKINVPAENLTGFTISLKGYEGMESEDRTVYRVQLQTDNPPLVRIFYPRRAEKTAVSDAKFLVGFEATDRFGIKEVNLNYSLNGEPAETIAIPMEEERPTAISINYDWLFENLSTDLKVGDVLEYWVSARDLNELAPGVGESEHLVAKVVSRAEKRAELLGSASDAIGTVGESTADQERLNEELGETIRKESGAEKPEPEEGIEEKLEENPGS